MKLYKYCDEHGVDILRDKRLKLTRIDSLNDPFEFQLSIDSDITFESVLCDITTDAKAAKRVFDSFNGIYQGASSSNFPAWFKLHGGGYMKALKPVIVDALKQTTKKTYVEFIKERCRVMCFSIRADSILMWSHYGKGHKGILFKFESDYIVRGKVEDNGGEILKVEYQGNVVKLPPSISFRSYSAQKAIRELTKTKYADWAYEQEYRILIKFNPLIKHYPYWDIDSKAIEEVVLGVNCEEKTEKRVRRLLKSSEYSHVILKKATIDTEKFGLNYDII